jgi:deazaflavin-dependent oxidoreductase (nitroreductase family)
MTMMVAMTSSIPSSPPVPPPAPRTRMRVIRPFTTHVVNPVTRLFAGWAPWFGILTYRGRKSGRIFRTPMNVFRRGDGYVFALTYGSDVDWVRNVVAAGECELRTRGRDIHLVEPELFVDPTQRLMPALIRGFLRINRVTEFMRMRIATAA